MSREILVITPENIEIEYELAGVGTRFLANLVDSLLQLLTMILVAVVAWFVALGLSTLSAYPTARAITSFLASISAVLMIIGAFLVMWGYFIYFEIAWNGQTPGKRQLGLRVIRDGGYPVNAFAVITRNLLRALDGIPMVVIGLIIAGEAAHQRGLAALGSASILLTLFFLLFTGKYQRLGDFVAGTMVVKQRAPRIAKWVGTAAPRTRGSWFRRQSGDAGMTDAPPPGAWLDALSPAPRVLPEHLAPYALKDIGRHVYEMSVAEYRAIRHAIDRRWQLPAPVQQSAAMRLAVPLMKRLGISAPPGVQRINYADLLEYLAVAFEQYRGVK